MSTFLQIVNTVRSEAGITGGDLTTLQGSGLSAESTRIKTWVNSEWLSLQRKRPDWQWMRQSGVLTLTTDQAQYTPAQAGAASTPSFTAAQFGNWKRDSFRIFKDTQYLDEMLAAFMPWDQYRNLYQYGSMRTSYNRPVVVSIGPDKSLWFGIQPDAAWKLVYEMYLAPSSMSADADTPGCPAFYHDLITYEALLAYGVFVSAQEVITRAETKIAEIRPLVLLDQLPLVHAGPPLA